MTMQPDLPPSAATAPFPERDIRFTPYPDGHLYTPEDADRDFGPAGGWTSNLASDVRDGALRIVLPRDTEIEGFKVVRQIPPQPAYYAQIKLKFDAGFDWGNVNDIKLPLGLGGGTYSTGGRPDKATGWSGRLCYQGGTHNLTIYAYDVDRTKWGRQWNTGVTPELDRWYTFKLYVWRNTAGANDGVCKLWIDDELKIEKHDVAWSYRTTEVSMVGSECFRGGAGDPPSIDTFVWLDSVKWWPA